MNRPRKITGVLVNVSAGTVKRATIDATLDSYYKALDCGLIDIVSRSLGPYRFDVICDDEALLKGDPKPSALDARGNPILFGNLFFCRHDGEGDAVSLEDHEIEFIRSRAYRIRMRGKNESWLAILRLGY